MTLYEFKAMSRSRQIEAICDHGVRLEEREELHYSITLYQINYFYVEVIYDKQEQRIAYTRSFNTTILLEPYLHKIDIEPLLQCL